MCCKTLNITSLCLEFDISCHGDLNIQNGDQQDCETSNFRLIPHTNVTTRGRGVEWRRVDISCFPHGLVPRIPSSDCTMCCVEAVALSSSRQRRRRRRRHARQICMREVIIHISTCSTSPWKQASSYKGWNLYLYFGMPSARRTPTLYDSL